MKYILILTQIVSTKLHCQKITYYLLSLFYRSDARKKFPTHENAEDYMSKFYSDQGGSCQCDNRVKSNTKYDLKIIVPVYNVEKYLDECIQSILNQQISVSYIVEIINDGSTDGSRQLMEKYSDNDRIVIVDQQNLGHAGARNTALKEIDAKYVMFVDSDDRLKSGCVEKLMHKAFESNYDIVEGGYYLFRQGVVLSKYPHVKRDSASPEDLHGQPWGKVYRSHLFAKVHFPDRYWFEDTVNQLVLYRLAERIATLDEIVYEYRDNSQGITHTSKKKHKSIDTYWITKRLLQDAKDLGVEFNRAYYEQMLLQTVLNSSRLLPLCDDMLLAAQIVAENNLFRKYFNCRFRSESKKGRILESIIESCDYRRMKLFLMFLWDVI